jgi:p-hydroxybenzoate 3-monooxygenase
MYFQCDPADRVENWSEDRIWEELQTRTAGEGFRLTEGRIFQKNIVPMRSFVCEPMQYGRLLIAGDAAHTVPPTGAKGLNLAVADVFVLSRAMERYLKAGDDEELQGYSATALRRIWRAQHFSWWMTSMLHRFEDASEFDRRRQLAELELVATSESAARTIAENYVGLPLT